MKKELTNKSWFIGFLGFLWFCELKDEPNLLSKYIIKYNNFKDYRLKK